jgi:Copper type II ascorbate-dependent monooxygenase, C-terminal domain
MHSRAMRAALAVALVAVGVTVGLVIAHSGGGASATTPPLNTISMQGASYTPKAPPGATDDYHCTLVNPHVTENSFVVSSHFYPNSVEVHHAILFLIPPNLAKTAERDDASGKGWTCFGESALPGTASIDQISNTPWLTAWAPGAGVAVVPAGTGVPLPAGSLVVMQIHYNLLRGDKPVRAKLQLHTVPATTPLQPLSLDLRPAPPDVPCPAGVTGPLCDRAASLADLGKRFGPWAITFDNIIEQACGRNPVDPPASDTTSCTWPVGGDRVIVRLGMHMHLTGRSATIVLNPGTPQAKTLLTVPSFNFDNQRTYTLAHPVTTHAGDTIGVTCTYDPTLRQELPQLRKLPPRFVTWGDGSSDEMCLGLIWTVASPYKP